MALYSESVMVCNLNGDGDWLDVNGEALEASCKPVARQKPVLVRGGKSSFPVKRRKSVRFRNNSENGFAVKNGDRNGSGGANNGDCSSEENEGYSNGHVNRGVNGERIISIQDHDELPGYDEEGEAGKIYSVRDADELSELGEEQEVRIKLGGEAAQFVRSVSSPSRKSSSDCFVRSELKWVFLKHKPKVSSSDVNIISSGQAVHVELCFIST